MRRGTPSDRSTNQSNRVFAELADLDVKYEIIECDPKFSDTRVFCERYGYSLHQSANVILVVGKSEPQQFAACVLLATSRLDLNHCVRKRMGVRRVSFAPPETVLRLTQMDIGGITALGLPKSLPIWIDHRVMLSTFIILGGGNRAIKLKISPMVFKLIDRATIVENLASMPS